MAGPVVLVTSASGRIRKEVIARLKSLGRFVDLIAHNFFPDKNYLDQVHCARCYAQPRKR